MTDLSNAFVLRFLGLLALILLAAILEGGE